MQKWQEKPEKYKEIKGFSGDEENCYSAEFSFFWLFIRHVKFSLSNVIRVSREVTGK